MIEYQINYDDKKDSEGIRRVDVNFNDVVRGTQKDEITGEDIPCVLSSELKEHIVFGLQLDVTDEERDRFLNSYLEVVKTKYA
jgi:hypothetical protein